MCMQSCVAGEGDDEAWMSVDAEQLEAAMQGREAAQEPVPGSSKPSVDAADFADTIKVRLPFLPYFLPYWAAQNWSARACQHAAASDGRQAVEASTPDRPLAMPSSQSETYCLMPLQSWLHRSAGVEGAELPTAHPLNEGDPVGLDDSQFARELAAAFGLDLAGTGDAEDSEEGSSFFSPRASESSSGDKAADPGASQPLWCIVESWPFIVRAAAVGLDLAATGDAADSEEGSSFFSPRASEGSSSGDEAAVPGMHRLHCEL